MNIISSVFIFCIVLFAYLHIHFHLKTSNDLEILEIENVVVDKVKLEEVCDIRQPVLFKLGNSDISLNTNITTVSEKYGAFDINIRKTTDISADSDLYVPLKLNTAITLFDKDTEKKFYSEHNADFIQETGLLAHFQRVEILRPYMVSSCNYDILAGAAGTCTPFRYDNCYRNFFVVCQGRVKIKLAPPKSSKYLNPLIDYENFEFRTNVNPWFVQDEYKSEFDKMKCLDVVLEKDAVFFIPAYWWYSIQFEKEASLANFKYNTFMNTVAICPSYFMHFLQLQNTKRNNNKILI